MKVLNYLLCVVAATMLFACESGVEKDNSPKLAGKSFTYSNGETGNYRIYEAYEFDKKGGVYHYMSVGNLPSYDTDGCALYYTLDDTILTIYHGKKGWDKYVQHTPYASGYFYGDKIEIDGKIFNQL